MVKGVGRFWVLRVLINFGFQNLGLKGFRVAGLWGLGHAVGHRVWELWGAEQICLGINEDGCCSRKDLTIAMHDESRYPKAPS